MVNIRDAIIYEALNIDKQVRNWQQHIMKRLQQNYIILIINEISMIFLKLLFIVDFQLNQAKKKKDNNIIVLSSLVFIIMIKDFYQFPSIVENFL